MLSFDPTAARARYERMWALPATFGKERTSFHSFLNELVRDRLVLVNGLQLIRDELQIAGGDEHPLSVCAADLSLPSVMSTLAHTHCGDRIHQNEAKRAYEQVVANRFAFLSEIGGAKLESFTPAGGGVDDAATLAHVTVAHQLDATLRQRFYRGNTQSFVLVNVDMQSHVGREDGDAGMSFGMTRETPWREPRAACGAIVGALRNYHRANAVHRRLRAQLGDQNYALLAEAGVRTEEGIDITPIVAAAIVVIRGLEQTLTAFASELDPRGLAHATASLTVNRVSLDDTVLYLARGTTFAGEIRFQGFGTDASLYSGRLVDHHGDRRILLSYDGVTGAAFPTRTTSYEVRKGELVLGEEVIDI
ncbi:MAG: hypothetical protein HYV09_21560 [Deltaproteobacteria bacterium]|nr:hypothetical protein [Deltaproteobacteria bacterium]